MDKALRRINEEIEICTNNVKKYHDEILRLEEKIQSSRGNLIYAESRREAFLLVKEGIENQRYSITEDK